jgi:hypothetical protein
LAHLRRTAIVAKTRNFATILRFSACGNFKYPVHLAASDMNVGSGPNKLYIDILSLIVAIAAFCVSGATWLEDREYERAENAPQLDVMGADLVPFDQANPKQTVLTLYVRNKGKLGASIDEMIVTPIAFPSPEDKA